MNRLPFACFALLWIAFGLPSLAQTASPTTTYTYLIYHKLAPGLTIQDALPVEREWKAINQAAVDEGVLIGWHMMVKQVTSNPNTAEYDYVSCIVSPNMGIGGPSPAAMTRLYGDSVQVRMANLQRRDRQTAPVVKIEIWQNLDGLFAPDFSPAKTPMVVVDFLKRRDPLADWSGAVAAMKQTGAAQVAKQQLGGWRFSALLVPSATEKGYEFATARPLANFSVLALPAAPATATPFARTFEVVRQEVFRSEQYTTPPARK